LLRLDLGIVTDTDDATGLIIKESEVNCSEGNVKKEIKNFLVNLFKTSFFFSFEA